MQTAKIIMNFGLDYKFPKLAYAVCVSIHHDHVMKYIACYDVRLILFFRIS